MQGSVVSSQRYLQIVHPYVKPALKSSRFILVDGALHSLYLELFVTKEIVSLLERVGFDVETSKKRFAFIIFDSAALSREKKIQDITLAFCARLAAKVGVLIEPLPDGRLDWEGVLDSGVSTPILEAVSDSSLPNFLTKPPPKFMTEPAQRNAERSVWRNLGWPFKGSGAA